MPIIKYIMSKNTMYKKACNKVAGFRSISEEFTRKLVVDGRSKSTHENYFRQMAKLAMHYKAPSLKKPLTKQLVNQIFRNVLWGSGEAMPY
ncbi:MAG: hypothetical protein HC819_11895 [Cyclobacteriaceae bacterium]|nr:hypothetical protein [Cyclobacteriaceae bacterium]